MKFQNPKPPQLLQRLLSFSTAPDARVLDCFAGSGTIIEAAIGAGRTSGEKIRYIAADFGAHFDDVLLPRALKVIHSSRWRSGTPQIRDGSMHAFKYQRLESYEDALDNLVIKPTDANQNTLLARNAEAREDYMLGYMLDVETKGSASLLNIQAFTDPFNYKLKTTRNNVTAWQTVDLVETFNYLIGLRVEQMDAREHRTAAFTRDEHGRLQVEGNTKPCAEGEGWTFRTIEGKSPDGESVLVVWRTLSGDPEKDNLMLETFFTKRQISPRELTGYQLIYVSGDNTLENLRRADETWKVQLIEENFHRLMFDVQDV